MAESRKPPRPQVHDEMRSAVEHKVPRRLRAQRRGPLRVWFGLGMFGLVGWSVAAPAVLGALAGLYIDRHWPSRFSWTLMLLLFGAGAGCLQAWMWIERERKRE